MSLQPPFALFVISKKVDVDYINNSLTRAWKGNYEAGWDLWVATNDWASAPHRHESDNELPQGTQPPLSADFVSPWAGKTVQECAEWLQSAGPEVGLNKGYFTVMDEYSKEDDTVLACRIGSSREGEDGGNLKVEYFPQLTDKIAMEMATNEGLKFDEKAINYQRSRMKDGKPDRSKAGPYD